MNLNTKKSKILLVSLLIVAVVISAGITQALNVFVLTPEKISTGTGSITESDFTVTKDTAITPNRKQITITLTATNGGTTAHSADITVSLLDSDGEVFSIDGTAMTQTLSVTDIAAGASTPLTYQFNGKGIVTTWESTSVIIKQTA